MPEPVEPVVFAPGMEGLIRALTPFASEAFWDDLAKKGFDRWKPLMPAYPASAWLLMLEAGLGLLPEKPRAEALEQLGGAAIEGFRETFVGTALFQFLKLIGLQRGLQRVTRSFRNGNNFLELELLSFDDGLARISAKNTMGVPEHFLGMLVAGCSAVGAKSVKGRIVEASGSACTYELTWAGLSH